MLKRTLIIAAVLLLAAHLCFSYDLVDMASSNQSSSTMGFEKNEYDYLLDPAYFNMLERSTLFFSLDGSADQFGENTVGDGFRGGYAWIMDSFSPLFALNYRTNISTSSQGEEENIELDYQTFDTSTGRYAQIDEIVGISSSNNPYHRLMFHFGARLGGPVNFALQAYWNMDRDTGSSTSYTNIYTDTASPSEASLSLKGNLTETTYNLIDNADNVITIEPEVGLDFGTFKSTISLGARLYNLGTADDNWTRTITSYSGGLDPTIMDQTTVTSYTGSYYNSTHNACFDMDTAQPLYVNCTPLNLDTDNTFKLSEDLELEIPLSFNITLYPELSTVYNIITTGYNDSTAEPAESSRTEDTITTTLDNGLDMSGEIGGVIKKTFKPSENVAFHIGSALIFGVNMYKDSRNRVELTHTQIDGNADGDYADAGTDLDTTYTESGWEIQTRQNIYSASLSFPIAVSYSPVKPLTFHAGTYTVLVVSFTDSSDLETGDNGYLYETYTDNLVSANSYVQRQKDGTDNTNDPYNDFVSSFNFGASGSFGFTLELTDNFKIDAVANASTMEIDSFSLTGIYSF